jgi:flagellar biosynthetic protein FlhB
MSDESDEERSLPATPRRLEQAREEGQVARSRELGTSLVLMTAASVCWFLGPDVASGLSAMVRAGLVFDHATALDTSRMLLRLDASAWHGLMLVLPWFALLAAAAIAGGIALGGWLFATDSLSPDFSRMSPARGLKQMFSAQALAEMGKALLKAALIISVTGWLLWENRDLLMTLGSFSPEGGMASAAHLMAVTFLVLAGCTALVAAVDVPLQLWKYAKGLRMSLEEVKRESRESEGDPQMKARIRSQQREAAQRRMMDEVPKADVVVTNPTHYAIALSYRDGHRAPRVVAKGQNLMAQKIREVAAQNGVPLLEAPPLARALYRHAELGADIPWQLYEAVALVLAWVMQMRMAGAGRAMPRAPTPSDLPVPPDWGAVETAS